MAPSDPNKLQPAVDALLDELKALDAQRTDLVRTINMLYRRLGKPEMPVEDATPVHGAQAIRPDQFFGRPLATAVTELLEMRRSAMSFDDLVSALQAGGHQIQGQYPKRTLAIAISKNRKFVTLPNSENVGLREWYPALKAVKNGKPAEAGGAGGVDDVVEEEKDSAPGADATEGA